MNLSAPIQKYYNACKSFLQNHKSIKAQPEGLFVILYTQICELFGRFGITALLVLYMTAELKTNDASAFSTYGAFTAFLFILPLLGGFLAERFRGFKTAITLGIALMTIGNCLLAIKSFYFLYLGLATVAAGSGFFTTTLTALLGKLYEHHDKQRDNAFVLYYIGQNIGVLLATILCTAVGHYFGYNYAFLLSSFIMFSGLLVFLKGQAKLGSVLKGLNETKLSLTKTILLITGIMLAILTCAILMYKHQTNYILVATILGALISLTVLYKRFNPKQKQQLFLILAANLLMMIFSAFLGQGGTTLNLFILRLVNRQIDNMVLPPSLFYALDPLFMILFGYFVIKILSKFKAQNQVLISFSKLALGLLLLAGGFLLFTTAAQEAASSAHPVSVFYVFFAYAIFPIAELCIMPITISLITRLAPAGYSAYFIGLYMLGQGLASYATGVFSQLGNVNFAIDTVASFKQAALIYHHVFSLTTLILVGCGLLAFVCIYRMNKGEALNKVLTASPLEFTE